MRTSPKLLLACLAACGPAGSPSAGPPLPLYPMALVLAGPREAGEPIGQLLPDGSITTKHDGVIARLMPDRVVDRAGRPKIVVAPNGDVILDPKLPPMHFDARGALVSPTGESIYVDDNGTPSWTEPRGALPGFVGVHFAPFSPAARRTAEVVFAIILEAAWSRALT